MQLQLESLRHIHHLTNNCWYCLHITSIKLIGPSFTCSWLFYQWQELREYWRQCVHCVGHMVGDGCQWLPVTPINQCSLPLGMCTNMLLLIPQYKRGTTTTNRAVLCFCPYKWKHVLAAAVSQDIWQGSAGCHGNNTVWKSSNINIFVWVLGMFCFIITILVKC